MGKLMLFSWSLRDDSLLRRALFSSYTWMGIHYYAGNGSPNSVPTIMSKLGVPKAIAENDPMPQEQYVVAQMLIWPARVSYSLVALFFVLLSHTIAQLPIIGGKLILSLK